MSRKKKKRESEKPQTALYLLEYPRYLHREIKVETIEKGYDKISDYITEILMKRKK